ncbi:Sterol uptake control protein 2 [Fusarium austroafricanum]|uniref:Sterol uptake control protein 2 n=1 Tax=Fusarium austroafricanum TaxID=2364996 RepID=A0A8H4KSV5_9HYPO|nr:Sterol uptake control protein 2 [Fusarium austroafricanum]
MSDILDSYQPTLERSISGDLFIRGSQAQSTPLLTATVAQLQQIVVPGVFDTTTVTTCQNSITSVINWIENTIGTTPEPDSRLAMTWCLSVSLEFLDLIRQRQPIALGILAHYCVVLYQDGKSTWYMRNLGKPILEDISNNMEP